jgi:hypothetical protein
MILGHGARPLPLLRGPGQRFIQVLAKFMAPKAASPGVRQRRRPSLQALDQRR